ncbi:hypothetical protein C0J52_04058 [Blattella germanica]|nr:hypothetical protein C0J52_04058 [Blattella germanica]
MVFSKHSAKASDKPWETDYKLPENIIPLRYDLVLVPHLNNDTFSGQVGIVINITASSDFILVHKKYLSIDSTHLSRDNDSLIQEVSLNSSIYYEPNEFWVIRPIEELSPTIYKLSLTFSGNMTRGMVGFYRSKYTNEKGETRHLSVHCRTLDIAVVFNKFQHKEITMTINAQNARRGKLFYFVLGTSLVLAVVCACLVAAIILLRSHFSMCDTSVGENGEDVIKVSRERVKSSSKMEPWEQNYLLPSDTEPLHYDIVLHPDLENSTFNGEVIIQIHVKAVRTFLVVHTKFLDIYETRLAKLLVDESDNSSKRKTGDEEEVAFEEAFEYKKNEFWVVKARKDEPFQPGIYNLQLKFKGTLAGKIKNSNFEIPTNLCTVYSTPGQIQKTKYALDVGVKITEFYIEYFGIPYPLPKLDLIAIPDFVSGAMEHWGLITFREVNLLYEEGISSTANKQRVATVIGHELAHMWFGNLMTLKWWNDLWLNEGFASYIEYKGVNHAHPDWQLLDQFLISDLHGVLNMDSTVTSHPIVLPVGHPDEITSLFDSISYSKGASVIRMLEDFMGEEEFRKGITNFLNRFKFANAVTQDLWDELQKMNKDVNITQVMDTWTRQMNYPVVTAIHQPNGKVLLTQQRFLSDQDANATNDSPYGYKWEVPISYITSESNEIQRDWLFSKNESVSIEVPESAAWYKINCHQKGYYRVNYDKENWRKLSEQLMTDMSALDISDRAHLLQDVFSLADAGLVSYDLAMDMTKYLKSETEYIPWSVAYSKLNKLDNLLVSSTSYSKLRKYTQSLVSDIYKKITLTVSDADSHLQRLLRPTIVKLACNMGVQECIDEVVTIFKNWITNVNEVSKPHPDIRSTVYGYGIKLASGEKDWDLMWNLYLSETDAQERIKLLCGLTYSQEPWILQRYLELSKNESNVRSQDFFTLLSYISSNPVGTPIVWDFVRNEWQYLVDRFTLNDRYLGRIIPSITKSFASELKIREMEAFFEKYPNAGAGAKARTQALERVQNNIKWLKHHKTTLENWLNSVN